jgi:hypothetical protein
VLSDCGRLPERVPTAAGRRTRLPLGLAAGGLMAALLAGVAPATATALAAPRTTSVGTVRHGLPLKPPAVPTVGAYMGADPNFSPGEPTPKQAAQLSRDIHRPLSIVSFYQQFTDPPPTASMASVAATGAIPMINVHCGAPDSAVAGRQYDAQLRSEAVAYRDYGGPVLLRWFWEMNLDKIENHVKCLGAPATEAQDYVLAFQHIWKIFQEEGATNVAFVWAPSDARAAPDPTAYYPGNAYVSWIGADLYDRPGYGPWSAMYAPFYKKWSSTGKPLILTETGAVGADAQAAWLSNIETTAPTEFPDLKGVVYVDAVDLSDYTLVPGTAGMSAYDSLGASGWFSPRGPEDGYLVATNAGGVQNYGCANYGSAAGQTLPAPVIGLAEEPDQSGYWLVGRDGSIYAFGNAKSYGSMRGKHLNAPIVGIAATDDGGGYWLVASDGGIFTFGDAKFDGSMGGQKLNKPIVGIAVGPGGGGYWLVASDGGIFSFGTARFHGSTGGEKLNKPIVGIATSYDDGGYWLVASDGGVFAFGDSHFHGALSSLAPGSVVVGIAGDHRSGDYREATAGGDVYQFPEEIQLAPTTPKAPTVAVVTVN